MVEHLPDCIHVKNSSIACRPDSPSQCLKCGWNPEVDIARREKNKEKINKEANHE